MMKHVHHIRDIANIMIRYRKSIANGVRLRAVITDHGPPVKEAMPGAIRVTGAVTRASGSVYQRYVTRCRARDNVVAG